MQEISSFLSSRPAVPTDDPFLLDLFGSTRDDLALLDWNEQQKQMLIQMQFEAQRRGFPQADHQIILWQERPVGRTMIKRAEEAFYLVDISLLPEARNKGIGSHLLGELLREAAAAAKPVILQVLFSNSAARRLYERYGFKEIENDTNPAAKMYTEMIWIPPDS